MGHEPVQVMGLARRTEGLRGTLVHKPLGRPRVSVFGGEGGVGQWCVPRHCSGALGFQSLKGENIKNWEPETGVSQRDFRPVHGHF